MSDQLDMNTGQAGSQKQTREAPPIPPTSYAHRGNDKVWSILCHLSALMGVGFLLPLVVYLAMRNESEYVAQNAREALNFHISVLIYSLCCVPLVFILIGIPLLIALAIGALVLAIVAAIKASNWECYRYPLTLRLVG